MPALRSRPRSPFADATGGLLLGSEKFLDRMRRLLDDRPGDPALPQLSPLRCRPSLDRIVAMVADHFGSDPSQWQPGRRVDDAGRAVAAHLARRHFGYAATEVAVALGYGSHGGVHNAVKRIESGSPALKKAVRKLAGSFTND